MVAKHQKTKMFCPKLQQKLHASSTRAGLTLGLRSGGLGDEIASMLGRRPVASETWCKKYVKSGTFSVKHTDQHRSPRAACGTPNLCEWVLGLAEASQYHVRALFLLLPLLLRITVQ